MANESEKYINKSLAASGLTVPTAPSNAPAEYSSRQHQYMGLRTSLFYGKRAKYSTDFTEAEVQGLNADDFYTWTTTEIRLADISSVSATSSKNADDFKEILLPNFAYVPIGAKVQAMGNTWIVINPQNMSSVTAKAVIARCNASYNSYDVYGNVITEPIVVEKYSMATNGNSDKENLVLMQGYYNVTAQLNDNTAKLTQNARIILGTKAYHVTGVSDFIQEFSGDRNSAHLLNLTVRLEEPTQNDDITENFIANGKLASFAAKLDAPSELQVGQTAQAVAHFVSNGEELDNVSWEWQSSDASVADVDDEGNIIARTNGNAKITAILAQNSQISASVDLVVDGDAKTAYVQFNGIVPQVLAQYDTLTITAAYFENGQATSNALNWAVTGESGCYDYSIADDGLSATITCLQASTAPLTVTASYGDEVALSHITLEGY